MDSVEIGLLTVIFLIGFAVGIILGGNLAYVDGANDVAIAVCSELGYSDGKWNDDLERVECGGIDITEQLQEIDNGR